jgi:hypothetical protein
MEGATYGLVNRVACLFLWECVGAAGCLGLGFFLKKFFNTCAIPQKAPTPNSLRPIKFPCVYDFYQHFSPRVSTKPTRNYHVCFGAHRKILKFSRVFSYFSISIFKTVTLIINFSVCLAKI